MDKIIEAVVLDHNGNEETYDPVLSITITTLFQQYILTKSEIKSLVLREITDENKRKIIEKEFQERLNS